MTDKKIHEFALSPKQQIAIFELISGQTDAQAAEAAGTTREQINR